MRAVVQRAAEASGSVDGRSVGRNGPGHVVFVGVGTGDGASAADPPADKLAGLRCFEDADSKFNRSVQDVGGAFLVISQFTLYGDARRGRRPSFTEAAAPEVAAPLVERFVALLREEGVPEVAQGRFQAHMLVEILNDGPVTIMPER